MFLKLFWELMIATGETLYMLMISTLGTIIFGITTWHLAFCKHKVKPHPAAQYMISGIINISRSIPFIILLVALIPFTG